MNRVLLTGRLTRDPELRTTAAGKAVVQFALATHEYIGGGKEKSEFHNVVAWDRLAETCGRYLGKGQQVAIEGRLQTRSWDDDKGARHWRTEIVANHVEMLAGRRRRDYSAESAAASLEAQALAAGILPDAAEPVADDAGFTPAGPSDAADDEDDEDELLEEAAAA
jgi:single-strand DNA-binding protein